MVKSIHIMATKKETPKGLSPLRYWLVWGLLVAALAYGMHRYFEYRNGGLDRRNEQLEKIKPISKACRTT